MNTMNKVFLILVLSLLNSACNFSPAGRVIPITSPTITPMIEETPTTAPTASITPAVIITAEIDNSALNETNIAKIENLATFGATRENCPISSFQDSAIETRFVNGRVEYLLALTDLEIHNINLWNLANQKIFKLSIAIMLIAFYSILTTEH